MNALNRDVLFFGGVVVNLCFIVATSVYMGRESDAKCFGRHSAEDTDYQ
jgi:hypothetical protein